MNFYPGKDEIKDILATNPEYKCAPVRCEIMSDIRTPIEVLKIIKGLSKHSYILESVENQERWGRYTFLGFDPTLDITYMNGTLEITGENRSDTIETDDPGRYMREILAEYKSPVIKGMPSFTGGLVGYFAYDYIKHVEKSLDLECVDEGNFKDCDLMLFDKVIAFDNLMQKIVFVGNVRADDVDNSYDETCKDLEKIADIVVNGKPTDEPSGRLLSEVRPLFDKERYCEMVEKAKYHIKEGDIFQIVLSNRLEADYEGSMLNVYRVLRTLNPSPYMFYFSGTDVEVAGASPETLVKLEDGKLYTFPLAGTRPRGKTDEEDKALEAVRMAVESPLLETTIDGARGVLINVTGAEENLSMFEVNEASTTIQEAVNGQANIIWGAAVDNTMGDTVKVTVVATGFDNNDEVGVPVPQPAQKVQMAAPVAPNLFGQPQQPVQAVPAQPQVQQPAAAPQEPVEPFIDIPVWMRKK